MNRKIIICWMGLLTGISGIFSQNMAADTSKIEYIYVEKADVKDSVNHDDLYGKDFLRKKVLLRLDLSDPQNLPLLKTEIRGSSQQGLVPVLLTGLQKGKYSGLHPSDIRRRFDYFDFVYHLLELEGIQPGSLVDSIRPEDIGADRTYQYLDIIADEGFSADNSKKFFQIRYLRLIWFNSKHEPGPKIVAVFPWPKVAPYLRKALCPLEGQDSGVPASEFLELRMFHARAVSIPGDPASPVPVLPQGKDHPQVRNIDLWSN